MSPARARQLPRSQELEASTHEAPIAAVEGGPSEGARFGSTGGARGCPAVFLPLLHLNLRPPYNIFS